MSDQQLALVTGTSSGIGLHTAVGLAAAGLRVVATMRDPGRADRLRAVARENGVTLEVRALDVTDEAQAAALVAELGRVDVLVNNAGRGSVATLEQLSTDDLRAQLEVNYVGVAVLTRLVLPGMREAGRGRVVTVSSVGGAVGQPFSDAYCAAKFAVEGLMQSLAPVVARFGIGVCVVEPGAVASDFVSNVAGDLSGTATDDPYAGLLAAYLKRASGSFAGAQAAPDAARTVIEACLSPAPQFRWQTSDGARAFAGLSLADLDGSRVLGATGGWLD